jgi:hypothetical protein
MAPPEHGALRRQQARRQSIAAAPVTDLRRRAPLVYVQTKRGRGPVTEPFNLVP